MKDKLRANGKTEIQELTVSDRAYSFLLVTYKSQQSQQREARVHGDALSDFMLDESMEMSKLINEAVREWKDKWKENFGASHCFSEQHLKFEWTNLRGNPDENGVSLESDLIGRHDFFRLLDSPWVPELGSLLERINQKLKEQDVIETEELVGVPCVAADFQFDGKYFVGGKGPWHKVEEDSRISLDSNKVHALMFIDLKKGMSLGGTGENRMVLSEFLKSLLVSDEEISRESIRALFLGFGIYEIIFVLESPGLRDLLRTVEDIRKCFIRKRRDSQVVVARGTSTMVFMLRRDMLEQTDYPLFEREIVDYSTITAIETGKDAEICEEIRRCGKEMDVEIELFDRQGHYDLIASYKEKRFSRACLLMAGIWRIDGIIGTSTIIKVKQEFINPKSRGDGNGQKDSS